MVKKVIFLENLPSNIISKAILVLNEDVEVSDELNNEKGNIKIKSAIDEAQNIIEEYMYKIENDNYVKKNLFHKIIDKVKGLGNKK